MRTKKEKNIIKLGNFNSSILIKDNKSDQVGTFLYSSPEIISGLEYNEKCDLGSLGITLFYLFFGYFPSNPTINSIKNFILDDNNNFMIKKTNIPNLNIFFKKLLVINPDYRMTYEEFLDCHKRKERNPKKINLF